jgi:hypothetical protein
MPQNGVGPAGAIMDLLAVTPEGDESAAAPSRDGDGDGDGPVRPVRREMSDAEMRRHLAEVGEHLAARGLTGEIVIAGGAVMRRYSPGELSREVQILLESLFE